MKFILDNKEWIFSGIGTAIVLSLGALLRSLYRRRNLLKYQRFFGCYEAFHYRIRNDGVYMKSTVRIHSTFGGRLAAEFNSIKFRYTGTANVLGQHLFIELKGITHDEYMYCILDAPLGPINELVGVFAGVTGNREPVCGRILLEKHAAADLAEITPTFLDAREIDPRIRRQLQTNGDGVKLIIVKLPQEAVAE